MREHTIVELDDGTGRWTNWGQNVSTHVQRFLQPETEEDVVRIVLAAREAGRKVRVVGAGHSSSRVAATTGTLISLDRMQGVVSADPETGRARILAGTRLKRLGAPLWQAGLSLQNQGDIDQQSMAGAMSTGTKGSGIEFGGVAARVRSVRLVNGRGEVVEIDESQPELLNAARVSLGLLGVITEVVYEAVPRYELSESYVPVRYEELKPDIDRLVRENRHFSFFYFPHEKSSKLYFPDEEAYPAGVTLTKRLNALPVGKDVVEGEWGDRTGPAYQIYPDGTTDTVFQELEYMVAAEVALDAFEAVRSLMETAYPDEYSPIQLRWQAAEDNYLAPNYGGETVSISVSGTDPEAYEGFLRDVAGVLDGFDARPHWGKVNFLTRERVREIYPEFDRFDRIRRQFDPDGVFLDDAVAELFAP